MGAVVEYTAVEGHVDTEAGHSDQLVAVAHIVPAKMTEVVESGIIEAIVSVDTAAAVEEHSHWDKQVLRGPSLV